MFKIVSGILCIGFLQACGNQQLEAALMATPTPSTNATPASVETVAPVTTKAFNTKVNSVVSTDTAVTKTNAATGESLFYTLNLAAKADLPECSDLNAGTLAYIKSEKTFYACSDSSWSSVDIKGDTGAQGVAGVKGDIGVQGIQGVKGDTGAQGAKGDKGDAGEQGIKGDTGDQGIQGVAGAKGDTGNTGAQGIKGDTGDTGAQGVQGVAGAKGDTGNTGAQGIQGVKGDKGDTGDQGIQGVAGTTASSQISKKLECSFPVVTASLGAADTPAYTVNMEVWFRTNNEVTITQSYYVHPMLDSSIVAGSDGVYSPVRTTYLLYKDTYSLINDNRPMQSYLVPTRAYLQDYNTYATGSGTNAFEQLIQVRLAVAASDISWGNNTAISMCGGQYSGQAYKHISALGDTELLNCSAPTTSPYPNILRAGSASFINSIQSRNINVNDSMHRPIVTTFNYVGAAAEDTTYQTVPVLHGAVERTFNVSSSMPAGTIYRTTECNVYEFDYPGRTP